MEIVIYILFYHYFITSSFHPYPSLLYSSTILLSYPYPFPLSYPLIYQPLFYHILFTFTPHLSPFYLPHSHSIPSKTYIHISNESILYKYTILSIPYLFSFIYLSILLTPTIYITYLHSTTTSISNTYLHRHTHTQTYTHT